MLSKDHDDALRALLAANFREFSDGVKEAAQIRRMLNDLAEATTRILGELASEWSQANDALRILPAEVLATCFTFLKIRDRMTVSHVSRAWRSIALAHPAICADIELKGTFRNEPAILEMALSRTGLHPIDLRLSSKLEPRGIQVVQSILVQHMHHLRTINWSSAIPSTLFRLPAPLLETLRAVDSYMVIPDDFLGALAGRLSTLTLSTAHFPNTCPALSTITHLSLGQPTGLRDAESFSRLFRLCPRLQSLSLVDLKGAYSHFLPAGPAPPTLNKIELITDDPHYDLMQHYIAWKSGDNLLEVVLQMHGLTIADCKQQDLLAFVTGAVVFGIHCDDDMKVAGFLVIDPDESIRVVVFCGEYDVSRASQLALLAQSSCSNIRPNMVLSLNTLGAFLDRNIFVVLKPAHVKLLLTGVPERKSPPWNILAAFARALQDARSPILGLVELDVKTQPGKPALRAKDGRALCAAFQAVRNAPLAKGLDIRILGFTADVVRNLHLRIPEGLTFNY